MNVLVIGSGGREHVIAYKIRQSPLCSDLFCLRGNGGTLEIAENIELSETDFESIKNFCKRNNVSLVVVGPEAPLAMGISDYLSSEGINVFGPSKRASQIEASKSFAKVFFKKYNIPTADFSVFDNYRDAMEYINRKGTPIVVKADGLARGKGVSVAKSADEAEHALKEIFVNKKFGKAGEKVVIEEFIEGEEASLLAFVDGKTIIPLIPAQDHKQIYDNDKGPNTGGMGAYARAPIINDKLFKEIIDEVFLRTMDGFAMEGISYKGILYAGLMIKNNRPYILEFNCRFGDPEAQAILPLMKSDIMELFIASVESELSGGKVEWDNRYAVCVVAASGGYPNHYEKGKEITGLKRVKQLEDVAVFHAGTKRIKGKIYTNGGRVLNVVGISRNFTDAQKKAYSGIQLIKFEGMYYRKDIGNKAIKYLGV